MTLCNDPTDGFLQPNPHTAMLFSPFGCIYQLTFPCPTLSVQPYGLLCQVHLLCAAYTINGTPITRCEQHKDLGVVMTSNLQWDSHIALISSKAYKKLGLLHHSFSSAVHINAKRSLYLSLIRSQLVYCSQIWRPYLLTDIILLERVQRRATKFILNDYSSNYKSRLIALRLLPLMMVYELYDISFFIKCLKCPMASFNIIKLQLYQILRWQHRIKFI